MKGYRFQYPINLMARALEVSRSGYYAWMKVLPSKREMRHNFLGPIIEQIHIDSRKTYGSRRVVDELKSLGIEVGRDQVSRLRKGIGLYCVQRAKFKATTNSSHGLPIVPNFWGRILRHALRVRFGEGILPISVQMKGGFIWLL